MAALFSATRVTALWARLNSSFWFVPTVMAVLAAAAAFALIAVDTVWLGARSADPATPYGFGPEGARSILSVIASSMITVASLIFSITMLSLQLASSQFGPRVLGNFMRDRVNQIVLGTFVATFLYCLFVLGSVRSAEGTVFVPHLAVGFGVVLAVSSVAVLIYFIHHIATAIRVETLLEKLSDDAMEAVDRLFPQGIGQDLDQTRDAMLPDDLERDSLRIETTHSGHVQSIGADDLMRLATEHDLVLRVIATPGRFMAKGSCVMLAHPRSRVTDEIRSELGGTVVIGRERTPFQDAEFAIRRIVELAQRALSPGINDPATSLYCIDRLGEVLTRLAGRDRPAAHRLDDLGRLRVVTEVAVPADLACQACAAIARYAIADSDVIGHLVQTMAQVEQVARPAMRAALAELRAQILSASDAALVLAHDRKMIATPGAGGSRQA